MIITFSNSATVAPFGSQSRLPPFDPDPGSSENSSAISAKSSPASILAGEDFADIAEEFSEDPGSGSNGGSLDWLPKGATVAEFENVMINSELNVVSEVFESQYGFHFLEVTGKRTEDITDYQIEEQAYSVLFARKYDEELENTLRSMRAEAFVEFKDLD